MGKGTKKQLGAWLHKSGVSFRVWAPFAEQVGVTGSFSTGSDFPMENENDGYWHAYIKEARAGQEYKFIIKNGENTFVRNDPRALYFTTTSGNSIISGNDFDWGDDHFIAPPVEEQVIYELHIGTFSRPDAATIGTFRDATEKLDYLADLGVNMIELMPISSMFMDRGWGYAIDYIFSIESLYGGRHGFLQFVKAAHARGIGIIVDVVYNHLGPDKNLDLWQFDGWHKDDNGGIYFYNDWRAETPWGNTRPDFGRPEVQQYFLDNVAMWIHDCRVDGLRVDSTIYIRNVKGYNNDPSADLPEAWEFMQELNTIAKKINPAVITIAEDVSDNEYIVKPVQEGGAGFSSQWELGFPHVLRDALRSSDSSSINLTGICSELGRRYNNDAFQRVIFTDSHDTAANGSSRLNEMIAPKQGDKLFAREQSLIAASLLLTAPGIPMLFQGQEFMEEGAFNDWTGLDWKKTDQHRGIVRAHKDLIRLRKNTLGLTAGLTGKEINLMHVDEVNKVIAYHRWKNGGAKDDVIVIVNFSDQTQENYVLGFPKTGTWRVRFNSTLEDYSSDFKNVHVSDVQVGTGGGTIFLPPSCAIILSQD